MEHLALRLSGGATGGIAAQSQSKLKELSEIYKRESRKNPNLSMVSLRCAMDWFLFSCSLRERDLVNLVDYFRLRRDVLMQGWGDLVDFSMVSLGSAMGWFLFSCSLRERDLVNLVDYFRLRRDVLVQGWRNLVDFSMVSLRCAMGWFLLSCGARWGLGGGLNQIGKDWKRKGGHCSKGGKDADGASLRVERGEWRVESGEWGVESGELRVES